MKNNSDRNMIYSSFLHLYDIWSIGMKKQAIRYDKVQNAKHIFLYVILWALIYNRHEII